MLALNIEGLLRMTLHELLALLPAKNIEYTTANLDAVDQSNTTPCCKRSPVRNAPWLAVCLRALLANIWQARWSRACLHFTAAVACGRSAVSGAKRSHICVHDVRLAARAYAAAGVAGHPTPAIITGTKGVYCSYQRRFYIYS